jgi:RNA polymerase sigma-70 factor (ECF subfamily)
MNGNVKPLFTKSTGKSHLSLVGPEKKFSEMTDEELILACQADRKGAIDVLLKRHQSTLTAMVRKRFPELHDLSDVVQEAQIRMWKSIGQLRSAGAFKGWLSQIVTNLCYDELRRKVRNQDLVSLDETYESEDGNKMERFVADTKHQPDTDLQRKELVAALESALEKIPQEFRQSVLLREVDGLSYEEIAAITNVELGTVKSRISRARTKIQKQMSGYLKEVA